MKPFFETWPVKEDEANPGSVMQCDESEAICFGVYLRDLDADPSTARCVADFYEPTLAKMCVEALNKACELGAQLSSETQTN